MNKLTLIFAISGMIAATSVAAQPVEPGPQDSPSAATIATCTSQIEARWAGMSPAERADRTQQELIQTCAINLQIASYASAQNRQILADQQQAKAAMRAHEAAVAEFKASKKAWQAEVQQQKDDYAARYAQWEADVAACKSGDRSKCAPED